MRIFCLVVFLFLSKFFFAQEPCYWQITDDDGLPSMTIYTIKKDSKGFMWIGTAAGLCRYDGKEFTYYRHPTQIDDEIIHLEVDIFDRVWYSNLAGQLYYGYPDKEFKPFEYTKINSNYRLIDFFLIDSSIVVNVDNYPRKGYNLLYAEFGEKEVDEYNEWENLSLKRKRIRPLMQLYNTNKIAYFYAYSHLNSTNLVVQNKSDLRKKNLKPFFLEQKPDIQFSFHTSRWSQMEIFNNVIFIAQNNFLTRIAIDSKEIAETKYSYNINAIKKANGKLWVAFLNDGLKIFNASGTLKKHYFSGKTMNTLQTDREGNIWAGSNKEGIFIIPSENKELYIKKNSSLSFDQINFLEIDDKGEKILIGGESGTVHWMNSNKGLQVFTKFKEIPHLNFASQISDKRWFFGGNPNMVELNDSVKKYLPGFAFKTISTDTKGNLWAGNYRSTLKIGLDEMEDVNPDRHFNATDSTFLMVHEKTFALYHDYEDNVWIGTHRGLFKKTKENYKPQPFLDSGTHHKYRFSSIIQSPYDSSIWAGTQGHGILKIKNDKIVNHYTKGNGLTSNTCYDLFADKFGSIWIAGNQGVQKLDLKTEVFENINKYDGFPTNEITKIAVLDSTVYVGTNKGLITFPIDVETKNTVPPLVWITGVSIFDKDTALLEQYNLKYQQNSIQINFAGPGYKSGGDLSYKYRMLGLDSNWTTTNTRFARFPGLSPGRYEFQVVALNEDKVKSMETKSVKFKISPPFWQTWWFRSLALLGIISAIGLFFNVRFQRIRKREKLEHDFKEQVNDLRAQALQTQMNPHFIFNSLNAIQHFLTENDQENAMIYLSRFAKLIRYIFEHSKEKTISLSQEIDFLKLYISLEELRFKDKIIVDFKITEKISEFADSIEIPPLLIQPIIENAFKHGLFHKKSTGSLLIHFTYENDILAITIEDDGIGRKRSGEINKWRKGGHTSSGVSATTERIRLLNSEKNLDSKVINNLKITDLYNLKGEPTGTRVEIMLIPAISF